MKKSATIEQAHTQIIGVFKRIYPNLTGELVADIRRSSELIQFGRKEIIIDVGQVCRHIYFIVDGAVRTYYSNNDGQEVTSWLLFENEVAISVFSFFGQEPSFEVMQTMETSTLLRISHQQITRLYNEHVESNFIGRYLTEQYYIRSEAKANVLRTLSAKERYLHILNANPNLIRRVPLGYLASYLGMNSATLSRIRNNINS